MAKGFCGDIADLSVNYTFFHENERLNLSKEDGETMFITGSLQRESLGLLDYFSTHDECQWNL